MSAELDQLVARAVEECARLQQQFEKVEHATWDALFLAYFGRPAATASGDDNAVLTGFKRDAIARVGQSKARVHRVKGWVDSLIQASRCGCPVRVPTPTDDPLADLLGAFVKHVGNCRGRR